MEAVWYAAAAGILAVGLAQAARAEGPAPGDGAGVLKALKPGHPRLFLTEETLACLQRGVEADPVLRRYAEALVREADHLLDASPVEHKLEGPRLLSVSRRCLDRVATLGLVFHLTGERKYAARGIKEMRAAAAFRDWNPSHFLDTAEMSAALAIGYDWLFDAMTDADRKAVREALVEKGLEPGLRCYRGEAKYGWWTKSRHNWSQVCNGGLAQGALAIADEVPEVAGEILASGLKAVRPAMANFGVDGGWDEGPGYWGYTMRYTSTYLEALRTALGGMHGLAETEGLAEAGAFRIYSVGPTGAYFNFADAGEAPGHSAAMFWMARTFGRPTYAAFERERMQADPFSLLWYRPDGRLPGEADWPRHKHFRGVDVVFLRTDWSDPNALWVGFKGGDNAANHSNCDLGTFVLEAGGVRWAVELGRDNYNLPAYFGSKRWTYYRLKTHGQNTLVLDDANQDTRAKAPITAFDAGAAVAVADLSAGYPMAKQVRRGVRLVSDRSALVQDEIAADTPVEVAWGMHTYADVTVDGPRAVLRQDGQTLTAEVLEPAGAAFEVGDASPRPPQRPAKGLRKLLVRLKGVTEARLAVHLALGGGRKPAVVPLDGWSADGSEADRHGS